MQIFNISSVAGVFSAFLIKKALIFHNVYWNYLVVWRGIEIPDFFNRFKGGRDQKSLRTTALIEDQMI